METKEISGNWHKETQILTSNDPACYGENLGVSIEGKFIVLETFGVGCTAEHNSLYEKYEKIAELIAHAPEMYALLERAYEALWDDGYMDNKSQEMLADISTVLAKARGDAK